jgi:hypothetical protein
MYPLLGGKKIKNQDKINAVQRMQKYINDHINEKITSKKTTA